MLKKTLYFIIFVALPVGFLILEGIGYYKVSHIHSRWHAAAVEQELKKNETKSPGDKEATLRKAFQRLLPRGPYIVIDTGKNILYLRKGTDNLLQAVVSCGSGNILQEPGGERRWVFDTPKGVYHVTSILKNPSWVKPDWAFIEEAEAIPTDPRDRIETGVLGDYALGFGDGFFIHGTLYSRLLGRSVTHGCIRVGDNDLENLIKGSSIETQIFIY